MLKKSFVSLSFSQSKLQLVKLSPKKGKVLYHATIDLPQGLIKNHQIQDINVLSQLVKTIWKKLKISEKAVGIVVPEFSTYIKNITIPKLEPEELDEAVHWQVYEFLPEKAKDISVDWRISKRLEDNYQVLAVAISKQILGGYVESVDKAGLLPLVVETPSLALSRLSNSDQTGKLIVYYYFEEIVIVVTEGERILGSSVIPIGNDNETINTVIRIRNHYSDIKVEKILIGGIGFSNNLAKSLQEKLKVPINKLDIKLSGMSEEDIQKYLIPISLQYKKVEEPSDVETVNLLPEKVVKKYEEKSVSFRLWSILMFATFFVWTAFFISLGTYLFIYQQAKTLSKQSESQLASIQETEDIRNQIKDINDSAGSVLKITKASVYPQTVMNEIYKAKPLGVAITQYNLDLDIGQMDIRGIAQTRGDLISFKKLLEESDNFAQIDLPITSLEIESNLDFDLSLIYLPILKIK